MHRINITFNYRNNYALYDCGKITLLFFCPTPIIKGNLRKLGYVMCHLTI